MAELSFAVSLRTCMRMYNNKGFAELLANSLISTPSSGHLGHILVHSVLRHAAVIFVRETTAVDASNEAQYSALIHS
eukprot:12784-Heterococcus_DN1.PRE.1